MNKHYLHHVPGRIRIRTPELKRDAAHGAQARLLLSNTHGVTSVDLNPLTGSVTATYAEDADGEHLIQLLATHGFIDPEDAVSASGFAAHHAGNTIASALATLVLDRLIGDSPFALVAAIV